MPNTSVDVNSWEVSACYPRSTFYPLSDGPATQRHRITKTNFRSCSTCPSHSQAPFLLLHYQHDVRPCLGYLRAPPLLFGRRPPQSNYPPYTVSDPDNGPRLEPRTRQGGISRLALSNLATRLHCLPPILHKSVRNPLSSYSKGSRGLSVLPRVLGIFTETSISLSLWWRQWGSRYSIRAGRNLPAKEFRYLRTVIVTAAVYRGFGSCFCLR